MLDGLFVAALALFRKAKVAQRRICMLTVRVRANGGKK
jgi:hypothetical protein